MKNPPVLVSVLGFFVAMAGFAWLFLGLRLLGFDWFGALGDLPALEHVGIWGWLAIGAGILWLLVAIGLWAMQPWAWMATMIVAGLAVFEAFLYMLSFPGSGLGLGMMILPGIIILYMNSRDVKAQFLGDPTAA
jgi:hypothetical protein